jgi:hypothetical protein
MMAVMLLQHADGRDTGLAEVIDKLQADHRALAGHIDRPPPPPELLHGVSGLHG